MEGKVASQVWSWEMGRGECDSVGVKLMLLNFSEDWEPPSFEVSRNYATFLFPLGYVISKKDTPFQIFKKIII